MLNPRKFSQDPVFNNLLPRDKVVILRSPLDESDAAKRNGTASLDALAAALAGRLTGDYLAIALADAQALPDADPPGVKPTRLYGIAGDWNAAGTDATVYVQGVRPDAYHSLGVVYDAQGKGQLVEVDVVAGTYKELNGNLYDQPGYQTDGAPTNRLLTASLNTLVAKNVLASTGGTYSTAQEAITDAFPTGIYRDTVVLSGYQDGYILGENSLIVEATGAAFPDGAVAAIGLAAGSTIAFNQTLSGGFYAGGVVFYAHNSNTANKLTITDVRISDSTVFNIFLTEAQASGLFDVIELVRVRGVRRTPATNPLGTALISFKGNTYEGHRPVQLILTDCDLRSTFGPLFGGVAPRGTKIYLRGTTKVSGSTPTNLQQVRSADAAGANSVAYTDAEIIVDERSAGSGSPGAGGSTYVTGTYTAPAGGQQTIKATDLAGLDQATKIVSVGVRGVTGVSADPVLDLLPERDASGQPVYSFDLASHTLTVLPSAGIDGGNVLEVAWLTGGLAAGYTDAQARAAQLNRTAAAGTTTVTLTAESATDYGTIANGSFTVNATGCVVGKCVRFAVGAGAGAPVFSNAPSGQPYKYLGATYASGKAFSYSLLVCVDRIEVIILAE
ncbi:hypothetical protein [Hymenobacter sp. BT559]|uniref:hypothetical protein n=1 Tax=Hymenobacter sp. BT559 TaxID=2795729 RepID=UPI0018EA622B|nr:hypothetical protein [Hymenobacter sp. BT559]MBJ6145746.1 hypothetical protein [Hymenobacter sp. BT559]